MASAIIFFLDHHTSVYNINASYVFLNKILEDFKIFNWSPIYLPCSTFPYILLRHYSTILCSMVKPNFIFKKTFPDISHYKKYNNSCFVYLSEILSKLQIFKVTNFMTFSDDLLKLCNFTDEPLTFSWFYFPWS